MNNFSENLAWLLQAHKQVIVPGLGAFMLESIPAALDRERQTLSPPGFKIKFDDRIISGDNLLLDKYCRDTGESLHDGAVALRKQVMRIKNALSAEGHYILDGMGVLHQEAGGRQYFISSADPEIRGPFYGFQPVEIPPVSSIKEPEPEKVYGPINESVQDLPAVSALHPAEEVVKTAESTYEATQTSYAHTAAASAAETEAATSVRTSWNPFRFILWTICGLLLLALLAQIFFAPHIFKNLFSPKSGETAIATTDSAALPTTETNDSAAYTYSSTSASETSQNTDSLSYSSSSETASGSTEITEPASQTAEVEKQPSSAPAESVAKTEQSKDNLKTNENDGKDGYCIILGTFSVQKNAVNLQKKVQKQGFEVLLLPMKENKNKVCVFISGDISNAQKELPNFAGQFPDAIIARK